MTSRRYTDLTREERDEDTMSDDLEDDDPYGVPPHDEDEFDPDEDELDSDDDEEEDDE